jgi:quercetin dioxygenase-like cupin family protein
MSESDARKQGTNAPEDIILGPGEGQTIGTGGITLKATGEETGGSIGFIEATGPPGYGPPRHVHYGCDELFYVLEGQFLFLVGERQVSGPPGTFVFIPRGTVHAAKVIGTEPGKVLAAYIPGGQELSFEEYGQLPRDVVAEKYDSEFVGPPL